MSKRQKVMPYMKPLIFPILIAFFGAQIVLGSSIYIVPNTLYNYFTELIFNKKMLLKGEPLHSFCVGEITIDNPIIGYINEGYHIFSKDVLNFYNGDDSTFTNRKDVFEYSWHRPYWYFKSHKLFRKSFNIVYNHNQYAAINLIDSIYNMKVYEFRVPPESFLLLIKNREVVAKKSCEDNIFVDYTKEYYPAVIGTYTKKNLNKIYRMEDSLRTIIKNEDYPVSTFF